MPRSPVVLICLLAAASPLVAAPAPLDPAPDTPYVWRVVVQARPHPLLPQSLRDQLVRDVKAALQPAAGPFASVDVTDLGSVTSDKWEPLWKAFAEKKWAALDAPAARKITGVKTHFLRVEVRAGRYRLEAKQLDGDTGLTSPVLRVQEVDAAEKLGRVAGKMLVPDFGPVATVESFDPKAGATVRFRAGNLGPLDRFVRPGDVLAVAAVKEPVRAAPRYGPTPKPTAPEPPAARDGVPYPFTLLRIVGPETPGVYRCEVLNGYRVNPLTPNPGAVGSRGMKLATVEGPVAVRLVRPATGEPVPAGGLIRAWATDADYGRGPGSGDALDLRDGVFRSARPMRNVATVTVGVGSALGRRNYPVPILGTGVPVPLPYEPNPEEAKRAEFAEGCEDFRSRVAEARLAQVALFDGLARLITEGKYQAALDRATRGQDQLQATDKELTAELARLRGEPGAKDSRADALLASADAMIQGLRLGEPAIRGKIDDLTAAIEKSKDPARFEKEFRAKEVMARIRQHLEQGEGDEALAQYDDLVKQTGQADIKAARDKLAAEWAPKTEEQKKARAYLAGPWRRAATAQEMKAALPTVRESADALTKADDRHGLRGLLASLEPAYARIKDQSDRLSGDAPADRPVLQTLQDVLTALRDIEAKARQHVKALEAAKGGDRPKS